MILRITPDPVHPVDNNGTGATYVKRRADFKTLAMPVESQWILVLKNVTLRFTACVNCVNNGSRMRRGKALLRDDAV